jgi:hypothetical protein
MLKYTAIFFLVLLFANSLDLFAQQENEKQNPYSDQYLHPTVKPKQEDNPYPSSRRLFFGGNGFLQLGTYTDIGVSPLVGYWVTPRLAPGIGLKYEYLSDNSLGTRYSTNVFGGSAFASYLIIKNLDKVFEKMRSNIGIMAHVEYELLSLDKSLLPTPDLSPGTRFLQQNFYVGGGIRQPIGEHSSFYLLILYNLNLNSDLSSYYGNPVFRIGFTF